MNVRKISLATILLAGASPIGASVIGVGDPFAVLIVDGVKYEIPLHPTEGNDLRKEGWGIDAWSVGSEELGFTATISGNLDPDPSIAYGIAIVDIGAPSVFGFVFGTPIVPTGSPNVVTGSIVGGLTDATGDGVSLTPTGATVQVSQVGFPLTSMGVDVGPAFAAGAGAPGSFYAYGPSAAGPIAGPGPGPWTWLQVDVGFTLSGGGDIAALTGFASIEPSAVPEPASLSLLALGAASIAALRRRSRK